MLRALAATTIAAVVCAVLSCWLVLIGWSLMGDAVAHAVLPGVVLAYLVGAPFAIGALVFGLLAVLLIGIVRDTSRVKEDAAIGIVEEAGLARIAEKGRALTPLAIERADAWLTVHGVEVRTPRQPAVRGHHVALAHPSAIGGVPAKKRSMPSAGS